MIWINDSDYATYHSDHSSKSTSIFVTHSGAPLGPREERAKILRRRGGDWAVLLMSSSGGFNGATQLPNGWFVNVYDETSLVKIWMIIWASSTSGNLHRCI